MAMKVISEQELEDALSQINPQQTQMQQKNYDVDPYAVYRGLAGGAARGAEFMGGALGGITDLLRSGGQALVNKKFRDEQEIGLHSPEEGPSQLPQKLKISSGLLGGPMSAVGPGLEAILKYGLGYNPEGVNPGEIAFPNAGELRDLITKRFTGESLEPKSAPEEFVQNVIGKSLSSLMGGVGILNSIGGSLTGEMVRTGLEKTGFGPLAQNIGDVAGIFGFNLLTGLPGMKGRISKMYEDKKADMSGLPKLPTAPLQDELRATMSKNNLGTRSKLHDYQKTAKNILEVMNEDLTYGGGAMNPWEVEEKVLMPAKKAVRNISNRGERFNVKEIVDPVIYEASDKFYAPMGAQRLGDLKDLRSLYKAVEGSSETSKFLSSIAKDMNFKSPLTMLAFAISPKKVAKGLFALKFGAPAIKYGAAFFKSPKFRKLFGNVITEVGKNSVKGATRALSNADNYLAKKSRGKPIVLGDTDELFSGRAIED